MARPDTPHPFTPLTALFDAALDRLAIPPVHVCTECGRAACRCELCDLCDDFVAPDRVVIQRDGEAWCYACIARLDRDGVED